MTGLWRLATNAPMYQRSHVQDSAYAGASAPDGTFSPQGAAVPVEGSHPYQGGDLPAVQGPQLRQMGQEGEGELFSHAGDGAQEVILLSPYGTLTESLPQLFVQVLQFLLQPGNVGLDAGTDGDGGGAEAILLRDQNGHHLVPSSSQ